MLLATCCEDEIVPHVLPFVTSNIQLSEWNKRDAAIMAFGRYSYCFIQLDHYECVDGKKLAKTSCVIRTFWLIILIANSQLPKCFNGSTLQEWFPIMVEDKDGSCSTLALYLTRAHYSARYSRFRTIFAMGCVQCTSWVGKLFRQKATFFTRKPLKAAVKVSLPKECCMLWSGCGPP